MSGVSWTLEYGGQRRPLKNWGIRRPQLSFRNLDADELTFTTASANVLGAPVFAEGGDVVLWRDDVRWFSGRVWRGAAQGNGRTQGDAYTIKGPWWRLQRTVYQQKWCVGGVQQLTPRVILGQDEWGRAITMGAQIFKVVQYAIGKGIPIAGGLMPVFQKAWLEECRDLTLAGAILRVLRLAPDALGAFDYSVATPVLNVLQRADAAAVTLDATAGDRIVDISGLAPRSDLKPAGVTFIYIDTEVDEESERIKTTLTRDNAGVTNGEGAIVCVIDLAEKGEDAHEAPPAGLAAAYWNALQTTQWDGTIRILEEECTGDLRPGKVVNISNGRAEWATMRAVIQGVTEDLYSGLTTAELGAPEHLAPQDFVQQQQLARRRLAPTAFPRVQMCQVTPTPAADEVEPDDPDDLETNEDAGIDPDALKSEDAARTTPVSGIYNTVDIPYCSDGIQSCARVVGNPIDCP